MTDVSVVIVTYNAGAWVQKCLAALQAQVSALSIETIVVDNASTDFGSRELAEWAGPTAIIDRQDVNLGFGRGCNRGVSLSSGRFIVLLNPDAIIEAGTIDALVRLHESRPAIGIVGGRVTSPSGELDRGSCFGFQTTWSLACFALGLSTLFPRSALLNPEGLGSWARDSARKVDVVTGCLLLISRALWDELAGFAPRYFMYGEDADLCKRAAGAGYESWIAPDARVVHALGASSTTTLKKQNLLFRGKATLALSESHAWTARLHIVLLIAGVWLRAIGEKVTGQDRAAWRGLWAARAQWRSGWPDPRVPDRTG